MNEKRAARSLCLFATILVACTKPPADSVAAPKQQPVALAPREIAARAGLKALLDAERTRGTVALWVEGESVVACADVPLCFTRLTPASTFKIANALLGLDSGVLSGADHELPWDGVEREFPDWNRDHTLRSAIQASAVPHFQQLARQIGLERMKEGVERLDYGNATIGAAVDRFWLDGPLAISPLEQLRLLHGLATSTLPVRARAQAVVRDILLLEQRGGAELRGKTGWNQPRTADELGWFVGYVESSGRRAYVAVLLQPEPQRDEAGFLAARRRIAERALHETGLWPDLPG